MIKRDLLRQEVITQLFQLRNKKYQRLIALAGQPYIDLGDRLTIEELDKWWKELNVDIEGDEDTLYERYRYSAVGRWIADNLKPCIIQGRIKRFFQRLFRGFDDSDTWSLDYTFAKWVLTLLDDKRVKYCSTVKMPHGEWKSILVKIIDAFETIVIDDCDVRQGSRVSEGIKLFSEYYLCFATEITSMSGKCCDEHYYVKIAKYLYPRLRRFKELVNGHPCRLIPNETMDDDACDLTFREWCDIIEMMLMAFAYVIAYPTQDLQNVKVVQEGLQLFYVWYSSLWW